MNKNKNFLDQLDGGWEDLIADTYKDANYENLLEFPLCDYNKFYSKVPRIDKFLSVKYAGSKIVKFIIKDNEDIDVDIKNISDTIHIMFNNVYFKDLIFVLESGYDFTFEDVTDDLKRELSDILFSFNVFGYYNYKCCYFDDFQIFMNETPEFNIGLSYTNMGDFCPHNFNGCDASKEEPIKFKGTIETKLKNMSVERNETKLF